MSKIIFNEHQIRQIEANRFVASVSDRSIQYTAEYKIFAVKENLAGKGPVQIFKENGFDLEVIGVEKARSSIKRWRASFKTHGEQAFSEERRGKGGSGRPKKEHMSAEKKLEKAEARIRLLEAELTLFKKARRDGKAGKETAILIPREKYQAINDTVRLYQLKNMTRYLCDLANVSPSGYYKWLQNSEKQAMREEADFQDYVLLKTIYDASKGKVGYRGLYMALEELLEIPMNHKKILRLMRKFNLYSKVRRANPYRNLAKATEIHRQVPNHLNRNFHQTEPGKVFLTDITYLQYRGGQTAYLSCIKDVATREIVAYEVSTNLRMEFVYRTLKKIEEHINDNLHPEAMIHSDQGFHYTHPAFQKCVKEMGLLQSMSRRGNCLDNSPMESFFGHFKDEIEYKEAGSLSELKYMIDDYMEHYNNTRKQWTLKKMTPAAYRSHLIAV
ncbi:IS3-like element ISBsp3 family transposase [Lysinibacillus sphaericus]|nr:IS3-like element ISBsp3 family transposase [Lysinibacillus sphaericus]QAS56265.1 IS3-like element ISBsp3 family transposase [Lysinibacillus sphaericus]QAS56513.1 IS3-like element ISBsp3 family transposase [Lysinibacillus sphaericus]